MGVFLRGLLSMRLIFCLPHARGGVSTRAQERISNHRSSPRPWGCFRASALQLLCQKVFPTPVGVFLNLAVGIIVVWSLPHARGGVSHAYYRKQRRIPSSPRPWGCFFINDYAKGRDHVFPTPVGVFPSSRYSPSSSLRLPHARGGVSGIATGGRLFKMSSPRPWGCF